MFSLFSPSKALKQTVTADCAVAATPLAHKLRKSAWMQPDLYSVPGVTWPRLITLTLRNDYITELLQEKKIDLY